MLPQAFIYSYPVFTLNCTKVVGRNGSWLHRASSWLRLQALSPVTLYAGETENDRIDTSAQNLQSSMIFGRCMVYAQYNPILSKDFHFSYTLLQ